MDDPQTAPPEGGSVGTTEIDPDAFTVTLDSFSGPLDLLLYLIKKNQMDIRDIVVSPITDQYVRYIERQQELNLEIAGEYMAMASELLQLKSRMILPLPPPSGLPSDAADPRKILMDRLSLYRRFQTAGAVLKERAFESAKRFFRGTIDLSAPYRKGVILLQEATLYSLMAEYRIVLDASRGRRRPPEEIALDASKVEDRALDILRRLQEKNEIVFDEVFFVAAPRMDLLVLLLALLELTRLHLIRVRQESPFAAITVCPARRYRANVPPETLLTAEQIFETEDEPASEAPQVPASEVSHA